jgi:hypothetical protein
MFGTTIDLHPARRDAVLAGGFSALTLGAALGNVVGVIAGLASGAMLGALLHVVPAEPAPDDTRRGRVIVRTLSGAAAGLWLAPGMAWIASGAMASSDIDPPGVDKLLVSAAAGLVAGALWYFAWGLWETRAGAPRSVTKRAE